MTPTQAATCGIPGCAARAVFANCTAEQTVVLCRRHLAKLELVEAGAEDGPLEEGTAPRLAAAGGRRW